MRTPWHVLWGSGRGLVASLSPQTRILATAAALAVCLITPVVTLPGLLLLGATVATWSASSRPPAAVLRTAAGIGLVMIGPVLLLIPVLRLGSAADSGWQAAAAPPWAIFVRGFACLLVAVAGASTLSLSALREGLVALPVPRIITLILLQVVQQTSALLEETGRIAAALAIRGGGAGAATAVRLLVSLPTVWLPRVMVRADRVANAMEVRGMGEVELETLGTTRSGPRDALALAASLLVVAAAILLRLRGIG